MVLFADQYSFTSQIHYFLGHFKDLSIFLFLLHHSYNDILEFKAQQLVCHFDGKMADYQHGQCVENNMLTSLPVLVA